MQPTRRAEHLFGALLTIPVLKQTHDQNGGYRVLAATSGCNAARPAFRNVSDLIAESERVTMRLDWPQAAARTARFVRPGWAAARD